MRRAVFLDRDGVINRSLVRDGKPYAPTQASEFELLPGVAAALIRLRRAGFLNIVVTNQPDVANGKQRREDIDALHARLQVELAIDAFKTCFHVDADNCVCRKPKPGLLLEAAREHGIGLGASFMVGDRWRDVAAGQRAGCKTCFFIDYGYAEKRPEQPFTVVKSLENSVEYILADVD
jgi:D-glycero-D-manno-heptose 1,7-bisphosphate phosphatase